MSIIPLYFAEKIKGEWDRQGKWYYGGDEEFIEGFVGETRRKGTT